MKDVQVGADGQLVCAHCGSVNAFTQKRTFRSKALVGVGALLTHKKLKCLVCGGYNQTGNSAPSAEKTAKPTLEQRALEARAQLERQRAERAAKPKVSFKEQVAIERAKREAKRNKK